MEALGQAIANLFGIDVDPRLVMERLDIATLQAARPYAVQAVVAGTATVALWRILQWYFRRPFRTLPAPPPQNFFVGNIAQMFDPRGWAFHEDLARKYGGLCKVHGIFGTTVLHVFDPKAMYQIFIKDSHIWDEPKPYLLLNEVVFGKGLLATHGELHKKQRKMINPVFSAAHLRGVVPIFYDVTNKLRKAFEAKVAGGPQEVDVLSWMSRTALELIGQSGLGHSFDPLEEGSPEHPYSRSVKNLFGVLGKFLGSRELLPLLHKIGSASFRRRAIDYIPDKDLHNLKEIVDIMQETSESLLEEKKRAIVEGREELGTGRGKDIMSVLLKANMEASEEDRLPDDQLIGQMSTITFAAMDTTSNALSRTLHLLALHPDVQHRLREEIRRAKTDAGGNIEHISYDTLIALPFMDAICRETLRLYPPVPFLPRIAMQDTTLPLSKPVTLTDGTIITEVFIPKGYGAVVSVLAANRNPDLWGEDAGKWKPERWLKPLPVGVAEAPNAGVYSHLMTFAAGPRSCVGFKFSQLEMKIVLCQLLEPFKFEIPQDKEIFWQLNGITRPGVEGEFDEGVRLLKLQLPLLVSKAD